MKTAAIVIAGVLTLGGATAYLLSSDERGSDDESVEADEGPRKAGRRKSRAGGSTSSARGSSNAALEARVEDLEQEVRALKAAMRVRAGMASAGGGGSDALDELLGDEESPGLIQAEVASALEAEREEERERRNERRRERMEMMATDALAAIAEVGPLSDENKTQISEMWTGEMEQIGALFQKMRDGEMSMRDVREQARAIHEGTDAAAKELLTDEQWAAYEENRPGPGRGRGPGRGGPPRG